MRRKCTYMCFIQDAKSYVKDRTMIDRREMMLKAWWEYRAIRERYTADQTANLGFAASFAACLRYAWKFVKQVAAKVAEEMKVAMHPNAPAIRAIRKAIEDLQYKGFRHNICRARGSGEAPRDAFSSKS